MSHEAPAGAASETQQRVVGTSAGSGLVDWLVVGLIVSLCVANGFSVFLFDSYTPRMGLLLGAGAPGVVVVARSALRGDAASRLALLLAGWIVVAGLLSESPLLALRGTIGRESSGLIAILSIGLWGIGYASSAAVVRLGPPTLLFGLGLNAALGFIQIVADISSGPFATQIDRATGFTPNPVYFGALVAAGAAVSAAMSGWRLSYRLAAIGFFAAAVNLSGSRVALAAGFIGVCWAVAGARVGGWSRVVWPLSSYIAGVAASVVFTSLAASSSTSTERVASAGGGGRLQAWRYGIDATLERPITGWGLGRFRAATQGRFSVDFVRTAAFDDFTQAWFDAHNIVIGLAVGIGLVGLALTGAWLVAACWHLEGPLVPAIVVSALVLLLQPAGLVILPLTLLLIGLAADTPRVPRRESVSGPVLPALLVGVAFAGYLAIGDLRLDRALETGDSEQLAAAAAMFPRDAVVADLVAQSWYFDVRLGEPADDEFREWSERSIEAEPDRPYFYSSYAFRLIELGDHEHARRQAEAALELQPWHVGAWVALREVGVRTDDDELADEALQRLCPLSGEPGLLPESACAS